MIKQTFSAIFFSLPLLSGLIWPLPAWAEIDLASDVKTEATNSLPIEFMNRHIFTIRSGVSGFTHEERALVINNRIKAAIEKGGNDRILFRPTPEGGRFVELNGLTVFQVRPADLDPLLGETMDDAAKNAAENLTLAVREAREINDVQSTLKGVGFAVLATLLFYLAYWVIDWFENKLKIRLARWMQTRKDTLAVVIQSQQASNALILIVNCFKWILIVIAGYQWVTFSLRQFPYTRPWGEELHSYLIEILQDMLSAMVDALPGLTVIFLIVMLTRFAIKILKTVFVKIESGEVVARWISEDTARPTRKITETLLWLFAFAMAYPYLPGSNTEAFKGLSVLVGIMLSIGGSGVVGQAASGLIMIYSRVLREGEYVKIGEIEGIVTVVGIFSTKIRAASGEEINVPNSLIGNSTTVNASRKAEGKGLIACTTVTIGYNTPWRQVHAMLMQAAEETSGLRREPAPIVAQSALADFYVEYRLCVQIERSETRQQTMTALHANIQDVFNEFGVQIMSPHHQNDPEEKVWVPKEQWYEAPAKKD
jgi:small-conductance mechanosensitive channel